ncbi:MAG TPA: dihydrolipoamide acetyltransferase family protein [Conexibacter sp.]|nr:dihydrolipoamide acetyltransferase family protein [Conexibacter sp.]
MTDITMPKLSDSMEEGTILSWLVADGAVVAAGDELVEIETDKATMTYEAPEDGVLSVVAATGEALPVGAVIARVGAPADAVLPQAGETSTEQDASSNAVPATAPAAGAVLLQAGQTSTEQDTASNATAGATAPSLSVPAVGDGSASPATGNANGNGAVAATPIARRLAHAHGVDLTALAGTGPRGRVTRADVAAAAGIAVPAAPTTAAPTTPPASPAPAAASPAATPLPVAASGEVVVQELTRLQQVVARRMSEAKATVPEFQVQTEVAMDAALALRAQLKVSAGEGGVVPSVNDLIVKASALALREHPLANGSYKDGRFELHRRINVGIAVAAQDALVVPTITDVDTRSLGSIATEARRLAGRVRENTITPPELSGGTFTVSNLGMYGMTAISPVINMPQAAILGVGATRTVLARDADGEIVDRQLMTLTLTCDHRILYGADAAQFLAAIRELLEQPLRLAL